MARDFVSLIFSHTFSHTFHILFHMSFSLSHECFFTMGCYSLSTSIFFTQRRFFSLSRDFSHSSEATFPRIHLLTKRTCERSTENRRKAKKGRTKMRKPLTRTDPVPLDADFAKNTLQCLCLLASNYKLGPARPQVSPPGLLDRLFGPTTGPKGRA